MMDLLVIRHARAVARSAKTEDAARPLDQHGLRGFRRAVDGLDRLDLRLDRLLHGPWLRAVQTAEILARILDGESMVTDLLAKSPSVALLDELAGTRVTRVAVVGHEPWTSELVAWLTLDERERGPAFVLKKGGVAWLRGDPRPGKMRLEAFLTPKVLRCCRS